MNMNLIQLEAKELLRYYCGCHGDLVSIATKYVADACYLKEAQCQTLRQRSYQADVAISTDAAISTDVANQFY